MRVNFEFLVCLSLAAFFCALVGDHAQAQSGFASFELKRFQNRNSINRYSIDRVQAQSSSRTITRTGVAGVNLRTYGSISSSSRRSKPFSSLKRGPTVSPYLSLSGSLNGVSDYYNIVRPQNERARANQQQQRQSLTNQRRLNQIAAQGPYSLQGSTSLVPTGHTATYMYFQNFQSTGSYYPAPQGLDKRQ